jgi:hypothetical protein
MLRVSRFSVSDSSALRKKREQHETPLQGENESGSRKKKNIRADKKRFSHVNEERLE